MGDDIIRLLNQHEVETVQPWAEMLKKINAEIERLSKERERAIQTLTTATLLMHGEWDPAVSLDIDRMALVRARRGESGEAIGDIEDIEDGKG